MKVAFIADIHSNLEALDSVFAHIQKQGITNIICIGDIVGYGANPNECTTIMRQKKVPSVIGNHDYSALELKEIEKFNQYGQAALRWTNTKLAKENRDFLAKLPKFLNIKLADKTLLAVHGSLNDPLFEYVYPQTPDSVVKELLTRSKSDILVMGHTHIPFIKRFGQRLVLNPGSVGQPRDNVSEACYISLELDTMKPIIHRVKYDIARASGKIITSGLPRYLAERLHKGN
ncbi:MAG: metallophosphoesterase family protein [Candidatus Woesearchaeota archaeon]